MYNDNFSISSRYKNSTKAFIDAITENYRIASEPEKQIYSRPYNEEAKEVLDTVARRDAYLNRYHSFSETVRNVLVTEAIYKIYKESTPVNLIKTHSDKSIMRAIVSQYVNENGYDSILDNMKSASATMSSIYNTITECTKAILENTDKSNPDTFVITPEMKDEFFKQLDYSNNEEMSKAINARVSDAMQDFITANTKDHEDITAALQQAQEKIAATPEDDTTLREYYEMKGKRAVSEIRNAPKGILHSMISAMCESVLRDPKAHAEFMKEGHIDMDKVVSRVSLMYTFLETLNTARIDVVNESYLEEVIKGLSE